MIDRKNIVNKCKYIISIDFDMPIRRIRKPIIECHIELREIKTNDISVYLSNNVK